MDLSRLNFDEFVDFFFDHDIAAEGNWYQNADYVLSDLDVDGVAFPSVIVEHMTRLFTSFAEVASRFSLEQINAAVWAMLSGGSFHLQKYLCSSSIPLQQRIGCIHSMYFVYSEYVAKSTVQVMENCFSMWWDFVASGFWEHLGRKVKDTDVAALNAEQRALLDALFETLAKILALPDERTQGYALHGLGHLHHPGVRQLVQQFLNQHRHKMTPDDIRWTEMCRDGTVM